MDWSELRETVNEYVAAVEDGRVVAGRWIYAACRRWRTDMQRTDLYMDWDEVGRIQRHFASLTLLQEDSGNRFELRPWQLWVAANLWGWKWRDTGRRRTSLAILQVARGNGKTTFAAGLALYDLLHGSGKQVHVIANRVDQAMICVGFAQTMVRRLERSDVSVVADKIRRADCEMSPLPARPSSLDGLNPSMWIADEAAEYKDRALSKLTTTAGKRRETLGLIISTPGTHMDGIYGELVSSAESVLRGDVVDDAMFAALYGIDPVDTPDDEACWEKANPGMPFGQPDRESIRRSWNTMKRSPMGRAEFTRYHCSRLTEDTGGWLDMQLWPSEVTPDMAALRGRPAWAGLDLSKSLDMTALVLAIPLDDGKVAIRGHYWWPKEGVAQREIDYRMPVRTWAAERRITLTPGREIDYESVRAKLNELKAEFDLRACAYDSWGSKYLVEVCEGDGIPMMAYSQGISTVAPGSQLWQNMWAGGRLVIGDDPIMRRACADAVASRDRNGNIRPVKSRESCIIDPLMAGIMAVHCWGGKRASCYEAE